MTPIKPEAATELLRCPFCGSTAQMDEHPPHSHAGGIAGFMPDYPGSFTIECMGNGCNTGQIADTKAEAITMWNRRAATASIEVPTSEPVALVAYIATTVSGGECYFGGGAAAAAWAGKGGSVEPMPLRNLQVVPPRCASNSTASVSHEAPAERNFCSACGKRTPPGSIHTCTPPASTDPALRYDESEFNAMVEKGTKAWAGVELRGGDPCKYPACDCDQDHACGPRVMPQSAEGKDSERMDYVYHLAMVAPFIAPIASKEKWLESIDRSLAAARASTTEKEDGL